VSSFRGYSLALIVTIRSFFDSITLGLTYSEFIGTLTIREHRQECATEAVIISMHAGKVEVTLVTGQLSSIIQWIKLVEATSCARPPS